MAGRVLVLGDVHGAYKALKQVLARSGFRPKSETLIFLGDVADGWPDTKECVREFLKIRGIAQAHDGLFIPLGGNHDDWASEFMQTGVAQPIWTKQGGEATLKSYEDGIPEAHRSYFRTTSPYYIDEERNYAFVHGGWPLGMSDSPEGLARHTLTWDRSLWTRAKRQELAARAKEEEEAQLTKFDKVFIGHTSTIRTSVEPVKRCEVWNLDQGAGYYGKLTIMDADTEQYWQSDRVQKLYPDVEGR